MMKKMVLLFALGALIVFQLGCSGESDDNSQAEAKKKGNLALFKEAQLNGCIECHRVKATVVGPSWLQIAQHYKDIPRKKARSLLVYSVKNGSRGKFPTWKGGNGMPALENRVSDETIERMVDYILDLNVEG